MISANPHDPGYEAGFNTRAIHAGQEPDAMTGAVVPAIYQVSTYKQDGVGGLRGGYEYSRSANPTRTALEVCLAALEGGGRAFAFASGLAGQDTMIRALLKPGDHVVVPTDAYGGTYRLLNKVALPWGVQHTTANISDVDAVRAAITPGRYRRHRGARDRRTCGRSDPGGGQHLCHALPPAAARPRRRRRDALDNQVLRRPQ